MYGNDGRAMSQSDAKLPSWEEVTSTNFSFPALAGWISQPQEFAVIRSLTESEAKTVKTFGEIYSLVETRMNLLRIVSRNFLELCKFASSHTSDSRTDVDYRLELDRLILNYLSAGYGLHEQFQHHIAKNSPEKLLTFRKFVEDLETKSFAYAFFRDFRNYAQHCELPVGRVTVTKTVKATTMQVKHYVKDLLRDYKRWGKSKLHEKTGELDLLQLLTEYNKILLEDYGNYIANYFIPSLIPIQEFAARLTKEVKSVKPEYQFIICTEASGEHSGDRVKRQFKCLILPEDVLRSLNIELST
jgi:hypothetical protein